LPALAPTVRLPLPRLAHGFNRARTGEFEAREEILVTDQATIGYNVQLVARSSNTASKEPL
jgi:hypothetical protein